MAKREACRHCRAKKLRCAPGPTPCPRCVKDEVPCERPPSGPPPNPPAGSGPAATRRTACDQCRKRKMGCDTEGQAPGAPCNPCASASPQLLCSFVPREAVEPTPAAMQVDTDVTDVDPDEDGQPELGSAVGRSPESAPRDFWHVVGIERESSSPAYPGSESPTQ